MSHAAKLERGGPVSAPDVELQVDDGEELETQEHRMQMTLLIEVLDRHWRDRNDVYVGGNMFVYYAEFPGGRPPFRGPDVFAVVGDTTRGVRDAWVAWKEGGRLPDLVVELTSPTTRTVDHIDKMRLYRFVWRTPEYVIFDPIGLRLEVFVVPSTTQPYQPVTPDPAGRYPCLGDLTLGLWKGEYQGVAREWLRFFGPDGAPLPTEGEAGRAQAAAAVARAEAESARAEAESARAEAESARAEAAERRIAALEAALAAHGSALPR